MAIDLSFFARIAEALAIAVLGGLVTRWMEKRPRLIVFYGHIGEFQLQSSGVFAGGGVHTHSVVVRNSGRLAAHNVRLPHNIPLSPPLNFSVFPQTAFTRTPLAGGGEEITFPVLVPGQQVTVSYLYFPPLIFSQINLPIMYDEGMARVINVLPTPQPSKWRLMIFWLLVFVGLVTSLYLIGELVFWLQARFFP